MLLPFFAFSISFPHILSDPSPACFSDHHAVYTPSRQLRSSLPPRQNKWTLLSSLCLNPVQLAKLYFDVGGLRFMHILLFWTGLYSVTDLLHRLPNIRVLERYHANATTKTRHLQWLSPGMQVKYQMHELYQRYMFRLCPLYLLAYHMRVTVGDSGLCCFCMTSFER